MRKTTALRAATAAAASTALLLAAPAAPSAGRTTRTPLPTARCQGQQTRASPTRPSSSRNLPAVGPASAYGTISKGVSAYFKHVNDKAASTAARGVHRARRRLPAPKAVEEARRLVEQEKVFAVFQTLGTPSTAAVWTTSTSGRCRSPRRHGASVWYGRQAPVDHGLAAQLRVRGTVYAKYLKEKAKAKVAVLYQNDDFARICSRVQGAVAGGIKVVAEESYEVTDPSVSAQMTSLARSKADVLLNITTPKFGSQALAADAKNTKWNPLHIVNNVSSSATVLKPVGFKNVQGVVSATYFKDPPTRSGPTTRR
ncbi:ABC transporter substrate-binding protein [Streptomyces sp. F001]|uniref:ABC transporter substrate-binding protein n=1 Tax=Streptomyces sp. F001 TaxID=1510026 RepID=UPI0013EEDDE0|nr:ABC transporter substrate-binding protein [Streptomyces sp. F001]